MQVKRIAECSKGSILQYFRPSLSYHLSLRPLFCLFLNGCFAQVLLFVVYLLDDCCHLIFMLAYMYISSHEQTGLASVMICPP